MRKVSNDPVIGSITSAVLTILGALHVGEQLGLTADELAMIVGAFGTIVMGVRAMHLRSAEKDASKDRKQGEQ